MEAFLNEYSLDETKEQPTRDASQDMAKGWFKEIEGGIDHSLGALLSSKIGRALLVRTYKLPSIDQIRLLHAMAEKAGLAELFKSATDCTEDHLNHLLSGLLSKPPSAQRSVASAHPVPSDHSQVDTRLPALRHSNGLQETTVYRHSVVRPTCDRLLSAPNVALYRLAERPPAISADRL